MSAPSATRAKGCLIAAVIWLVILGVLAVAYRFLVHPHLAQKLNSATGSASQYKQEIAIGLDSFSGYALLRSDDFRDELKTQGYRINLHDDKGDVSARLEALRAGRLQLAAVTVDSLLSLGAKLGFPASIVAVIDESRGADAVVALKSAVSSLTDLDAPDARIVFTAASPSEFLARVVMAHFNFSKLGTTWSTPVESPNAVLKALRATGPTDKRAFVLWEPYVSQARELPGVQVLLDSSQLRGHFLDVLVVRREFLRDQPDVVQAVVEAHARSLWHHSHAPDGLVKLVLADAHLSGSSLTEAQARQVVAGIQWKNVLENYAHFGLLSSADRAGLPALEDLLGDITDVLVKTHALAADPLPGQRTSLYHDRILAAMQVAKFHPGLAMNLIGDSISQTNPLDAVRGELDLAALTDEQWQRLRPVGELRTDPISFTRASANLVLDGDRAVSDFARELRSFPRYYLRVVGHARAEGDPEANRTLAQARAETVVRALVTAGLDRRRVHAEFDLSPSAGAEAQAVSFVVGQVPY